MEENKEQAEKCRDIGASSLKRGDFARAVKMLQKSLQLYPLPGVDALLSQAKSQMQKPAPAAAPTPAPRAAATAPPARSNSVGADGRAYTDEQVRIVQEVLKAKEGGRGAHYRVLKISSSATESEIKKAYRKLSLKVHPDKNSAPQADEAFKAVGLAYATLSDDNKRTIYDRYDEEDPDNRGGGGMRPGGMHMRPGQEVSPEEIFNMFFGGAGGMPGMHRGGPGFHMYTNFGGGPQFRAGNNRRQRRGQGFPQQQAQQESSAGLGGLIFQLLPVLLIMLASFFRYDENQVPSAGRMPGEGQYFSMTVG